MKFEREIAKRLVFSKNQETKSIRFFRIISICSITLSVACFILAISIGKAFSSEIENKIASLVSHISIENVLRKTIVMDTAQLRVLASIPQIESVRCVLEKEIIVRVKLPGENTTVTEPALLKAIRLEDTAFVKNKLIEGTCSKSNTEIKIIIGKTLAEKLHVRIDSKITFLALSESETIFFNKENSNEFISGLKIKTVTVVGIYRTGLSDGFDDRIIFANLSDIQAYLQVPNRITNYEIILHSKNDMFLAMQTLQREFGYPFLIVTMYEKYAPIFSWLKLQENITPLVLLVMIVVAIFNIFSLVLITIVNKKKTIGVLLSFGSTLSQIEKIFLWYSFFICTIGIVIGNLIAFILLLFQKEFGLFKLKSEMYFLDVVPTILEPQYFIWTSIITLFFCMMSVFIPLRIARKFTAVQALYS